MTLAQALCIGLVLGLCASAVSAQPTEAPSPAPASTASSAALQSAASQAAASLLRRSIEYHDRAGVWSKRAQALEIEESRPNGSTRTTRVVLDSRRGLFRYVSEREGRQIEAVVDGSACTLLLDGSTEVSNEEVEALGLGCERLQWIRNYYSYVWGLPMKLLDPGTRLDARPTTADFLGRAVVALRVTYDESVGSDVWSFYLDPATMALVGYRFYHDEAANDGEYIVLEGELEDGGIRLPQRRTWYTNGEDKLLGTDTLVGLESADD